MVSEYGCLFWSDCREGAVLSVEWGKEVEKKTK